MFCYLLQTTWNYNTTTDEPKLSKRSNRERNKYVRSHTPGIQAQTRLGQTMWFWGMGWGWGIVFYEKTDNEIIDVLAIMNVWNVIDNHLYLVYCLNEYFKIKMM